MINPCQALLLAGVAAVAALGPARSAEEVPAGACYYACVNDVCSVSRGPTFAGSRRIYQEDHSLGGRVRSRFDLGPNPGPAIDALKQLQDIGACPTATDEPPDACTVVPRPLPGRSEQAYAIVSRGHGEQRTIKIDPTEEKARHDLGRLTEVGQCGNASE